MPRPVRTVKPPSAPGATVKTTTVKTTVKKLTTKIVAKSRTTRSGTKDIPDNLPEALLPAPSSTSKKSSPAQKTAVKAAVTKRSTRSKVLTTTTTVQTPSPHKRTTRRKPISKEPAPEAEPEKEKELELSLPADISPPPSSPEIQVPASSNAENHTPSPTQIFASSPPPMPSTPLAKPRRRVVLEFGSDAGYSPPAAKVTSAERPRLRELQPLSLEPLDDNLPADDEDEDIDPRASPTPKRGRRTGFLPTEEEEPPTSAQPERRAPAPKPPGGIGFYVPGIEETFTIYSDPKSPTPPLPPASTLDDTMRPPESTPGSTPVKTRKRRSSGAVVDSDEDVASQADIEDEAEAASDRKGKRRKAQAEKLRLMKTDELRDLLPRRKKTSAKNAEDRDEFDVLSTSEDTIESEEAAEEESEDELSRPGRTTRSGRAGKKGGKTTTTKKSKKAAAKVPAKRANTAQARHVAVVTKSAWSKPLLSGVKKTYSRASEKENSSPVRNRVRDLTSSGSEETVVIADGVVEKSGRRKLKEVVEKFKEVDRWEMEFEDVSPRSLEVSEEGR